MTAPAHDMFNRNGPIMLIDGVCNLCNGTARFMIAHERDSELRFASLQSRIGGSILAELDVDVPALSTIVLVENGKAFTRSDAVLRALDHVRAPWRWLKVCRIIPRCVRDWMYDRIAQSRYRLFGTSETCPAPAPDQQDRFLDAQERISGGHNKKNGPDVSGPPDRIQ